MIVVVVAILIGVFTVAGLVLWFIAHSSSGEQKADAPKSGAPKSGATTVNEQTKEDVEHIFNDEFREELRNRGRLHFEKIIGENAMFLQQDLRLTTSQLNEFMKSEITHVLKDEFAKYEQSINDAKQLAIDSIEKTQSTIEQQRQLLTQQLQQQLHVEKTRSLNRFEAHMADVVNHYVLEAVGEQIDLSEQLEFILAQLERNKEAMIQDIRDGA